MAEKELDISTMRSQIEQKNAEIESKKSENEMEDKSLKYKCEFCDYQSNSKQGLKTHITRKHTKYSEETRPINCEVCEIEFICTKELSKHMISHCYKDASILKFKCDECDFWGTNTITMEMHFRRLHSEIITCGLCDFVANNLEELDIHTFTCEIFKCNRCKKTLKTFQDMKTHFEIDHNGESFSLNHYCSNRGNLELIQEKLHFAKELFKKK